jgi:small subunit ribosomal protein S30e
VSTPFNTIHPSFHRVSPNILTLFRSLARAGKVKAATPKVEKQEKAKSPKGRARKRIIYTRRFVNVTMTGGKRKV